MDSDRYRQPDTNTKNKSNNLHRHANEHAHTHIHSTHGKANTDRQTNKTGQTKRQFHKDPHRKHEEDTSRTLQLLFM